jgi:hypothetical protein
MRAAIPLGLLGALCGVTSPLASQPTWSGQLTVGYTTGLDPHYGDGSIGATGRLWTSLSPTLGLGLEAGIHRLGNTTTRIADFNGQPGAIYREDYARTLMHGTGLIRLRAPSGSIRPYGIGGVGAYGIRIRDQIEVTDPQGNRVPFYDFFQVRTDTKPGFTLGAGLELPGLAGPLVVGVEARWHGVLGGFPASLRTADFVSIGLTAGFGL